MTIRLNQKHFSNNTSLTNSIRAVTEPVNFKSTQNNILEKTPKTDDFELSKNKNNNKARNILFATAGVILSAVIGTLAIKKYKEIYLKEAQKTFREVFLRNDINQEDTIKMLKRYKEIEALKKTNTRENYIKALFEEGKANFGFKDRPMKLTFEKGATKTECGSMSRDNAILNITPNCPLSYVMNTIHHELRHAKQHEICINYSPKTRTNILCQIIGKESKQEKELKTLFDKIVDEYIDKAGANLDKIDFYESISTDVRIINYLEKYFGKLSPNNIKKEQKEFAEKLVKALDNYKLPREDRDAYWNNFTEKDARWAGEKIANLFGFMSKLVI